MAYEAELAAARAAALKAGDLIRNVAGRLATDAVREKGHNELVTVADEQAQALIVEQLTAKFPAYGLLAEETLTVHLPSTYTHRWIIDPIDGTTNFTHGVPPFAVSIALEKTVDDTRQIVVGVVLEVHAGELFHAVRGEGCFLNDVRQCVSATPVLAEALVATGFPYKDYGFMKTYLQVLQTVMRQTRGVRRHGSAAVDLAYTAVGRFDGFFERGLAPWDVAAGVLLVEEAGGRVTDFAGRPDYIYGSEMVASNGALHHELLATAAALRSQPETARV